MVTGCSEHFPVRRSLRHAAMLFSRTEQFTQDSGEAQRNTATACKSGRMVLVTRVIGSATKPVEKVNSGMLTGMNSKANG